MEITAKSKFSSKTLRKAVIWVTTPSSPVNTLYTAFMSGIGWSTVLDRETGFSELDGYLRDIETGFLDMEENFSLPPGIKLSETTLT